MAGNHGQWSRVRGARRNRVCFAWMGIPHPQALRFRTRRIRPLSPSLDFLARPRPHLLLGLLLPGVSDSRTDWPSWDSSGRRLPPTDRWFVGGTSAFLVRSFAALDLQRFADAAGAVLGWHDRLTAAGAECVATSHAGGQLRLLSLLRRRRSRFFRLSIR